MIKDSCINKRSLKHVNLAFSLLPPVQLSRLGLVIGLALLWAAPLHAGKPMPPAAPSSLSAADNSSDESGFVVQRGPSASGPWTQIATLGAGATSYANAGLSAGTTYYYEVYAYNSRGSSAYAGPVGAATAPVCSFSLSPSSASFAASGGSGNMNLTTSAGCAWTATSTASWIIINSGFTGSGTGTVNYSVAANSGSARSGTMTIAGQTFSVDQAAAAVPSCAYSLSASSAPCTASGGSGSVNVTCGAGCTWSASSGATWLHTSSSGSGNGTATYTVDANTSSSSRSGTLTIAAQTFTVSQGAAAASTGGQLQWVRTMASAMGYTAEGLSVAADSSGNVVVVGDYAGPMDLGSGPCPHNNIFDAFVAKYTAQGGLLWSKAFGGGARNYARAVAVDSQGNVIVAGDFSGTADFGGMILTAPDPYGVWAADMFVAKYSPSGSLLWVKSFGGASGDMGNAVAVDGSDNIILAGGLSSYGVNFGSGITLSGIDMVLVKLSPE